MDDAVQVKFKIYSGEEPETLEGFIVANRYLVCGCCGGTWDLEADELDYEVEILEYYNDWVDLTEFIRGT